MNYKVTSIPEFDRQAKKLSKKYPSLKKELFQLIQLLSQNPMQGNSLGERCFKIRIAIASKSKGKRGRARIITYVHVSKTEVYLLSIYDKSEQDTISVKELKTLLSRIIS